ncbi:hypothetical protein H2200_007270 [Cladophialophora chaetospira]|uniref:protein-tyrosine-phosphatase n=1 Tax=Cladophialophora chaetospira TaxID=386627 RepID=A0AA38X7I0_9EURO|nr:hypothetical protein H2200_007270 [Cladophialophora chaetospira]
MLLELLPSSKSSQSKQLRAANVFYNTLSVKSSVKAMDYLKMVGADPRAVPSKNKAPLVPDEIIHGLYLSDLSTAAAVMSPNYNAPGLNRPKIKYILSIVSKPEQQPKIPPGRESEFVTKLIVMRDLPTSNLLAILHDACKFLGDAANNEDGGVLVHCHKGVSRSAAVVIAAIMHDKKLNYSQALQHVRRFRSKVWPNEGFQKQLILWYGMGCTIYDREGKEKHEYVQWKAENEAEIRQLESSRTAGAQGDTIVPSTTFW